MRFEGGALGASESLGLGFRGLRRVGGGVGVI